MNALLTQSNKHRGPFQTQTLSQMSTHHWTYFTMSFLIKSNIVSLSFQLPPEVFVRMLIGLELTLHNVLSSKLPLGRYTKDTPATLQRTIHSLKKINQEEIEPSAWCKFYLSEETNIYSITTLKWSFLRVGPSLDSLWNPSE